MPTPDCVSAISDIVIAIAALVTAGVAVKGLDTWSEQLKGTAHFEVARSLVKATYKLRNAIADFRSPLIHGVEFPEGFSVTRGSSEERAEAYLYVFRERWKPISESIQEFDAQSLEAEALWGEEVSANTETLRRLVWNLWIAVDCYVENERTGGENFKCDPNFGVSTRSKVFASPNATDNILSNEIATAIKAIEASIKPHLRRQSHALSWNKKSPD